MKSREKGNKEEALAKALRSIFTKNSRKGAELAKNAKISALITNRASPS
jgi:hypothetical protein